MPAMSIADSLRIGAPAQIAATTESWLPVSAESRRLESWFSPYQFSQAVGAAQARSNESGASRLPHLQQPNSQLSGKY